MNLPLYNPPHPSSLTILFKLPIILSCGPSFFATCIRLLIVIYGYVMLVANSFPIAPRKNASLGKTLPRLLSNASFSCSNIVYCNIGLMTSISAGNTPAKRAVGPSSRKRERRVLIVEGFRGFWVVDGEESEGDSEERAVILVFMTQIGLVMRTVALPASAPAIIDSTVVSFWDARPARSAARVNNARVHSYPRFRHECKHCTDRRVSLEAGMMHSNSTQSWSH